ncbi:methyl-accepting chemotaxis protein [Herbaspirillum rhizosphaerae]|uniref:methyl-accepting chemotaxis protein n=1 Tax=Herbaspirillum rhizosphaerae TaxID=346179 RepID=UPI0009F88400|nr:methyl-accepting chemotaxis protein [Herbaspirillum rhizosphaerae]
MKPGNFSIRVRLGMAFAFVLLMMATLIVISLLQVQRISAIQDQVMEEDWAKLDAIQTIDAMTRSNMGRILSLFITTDKAGIAKIKEEITGNIAASLKAVDTLDRLVMSDDGKKYLDAVKQARQKYATSYLEVSKLLDAGDDDAASSLVHQQTMPLLDALQTEIKVMVEHQRDVVEKSRRESQRIINSARLVMIALGAATLVLATLLAWRISRSITRPLARAVVFARTVAEGDLRQQITVTSRDETGQMLLALKDMNAGLGDIIAQVAQGAHAILQASQEIARGNMDLSARTEAQASSLEETASSLEQLTGAVHQNADHAREVSQLVSSAANAAHEGGLAVGRVIETMAAIDKTSRQVVNITAIIDGIAFQTNILALNAAVEAARAGESGRGFAVVATEVRSLAQRAATASHEIKALIDESIQQVEAGGRQVEDAGRTIENVVVQVRGISQTMADIALASNEQSSGIDQINHAVSEMDQVTQQNAALVEQAAAAAAALSEQAMQLEHVAGRFKLAQVAGLSGPLPVALPIRSPAQLSTQSAPPASRLLPESFA